MTGARLVICIDSIVIKENANKKFKRTIHISRINLATRFNDIIDSENIKKLHGYVFYHQAYSPLIEILFAVSIKTSVVEKYFSP